MDTTRQETHSMEVTATSQQKERSNLSFLKVHVHIVGTFFEMTKFDTDFTFTSNLHFTKCNTDRSHFTKVTHYGMQA